MFVDRKVTLTACMTMRPAAIALVDAIACTILPAIPLTANRDCRGIPIRSYHTSNVNDMLTGVDGNLP
jgi:hypothetical protein